MSTMLALPNDVLRLLTDFFDIRRLDTNSWDFHTTTWQNHKTLLDLSAICRQLRFVVEPVPKQTWWFRANNLNSKHDLLEFFDARCRKEITHYAFLDTMKWKSAEGPGSLLRWTGASAKL